jgi:hypothetical protein
LARHGVFWRDFSDRRQLACPSVEQPPAIANHVVTGSSRGGIIRVPTRMDGSGLVLDADLDFGVRFDVDLLKSRRIEN